MIAPNSVFIDASMMHLIATTLQIFRKDRLIWQQITKKKCVRKQILANLVTRLFKNFSPVQTVVVPPEETNISRLLTSLFIFMRPPSWKVASAALYLYDN